MDMERALHELGVADDTLDEQDRRQLETQGYLLFPSLLAPHTVVALTERLEQLARSEGSAAGREVYQEPGALRVSDLVNKDPCFDVLYTHPKVLAGARQLLGPEFKVSSVDCRFALPGEGHQKLHQDWQDWRRRYPPPDASHQYACSSLWLLDEFTADNGATRFVPGSHRSGRRPDQEMEDRLAPHPDEELLLAPAGSLFFYSSHLWHGGTRNTTDRPRRVAASSFVQREQRQLTNQRKLLRPETAHRLSPEQRVLLDVD